MRSISKTIRFARAALAAGALAALTPAACSDGPKETGSVEILHWWKQGGEAEAIGKLLDLFKQKNPTVKIVDSSVDGSKLARAAIRNRISMGTPPDTFQANGGWGMMAWVLYNNVNADQSQMQELDPSMLDWIDQVPPEVLDSVSYKGKVYAVPLNIHRLNTFFYNKAVFEKAHIDAAALKSLDDVFAAAETIKQYNQAHQELPAITPISLGFRATEGDMATDDTWTLALVFFENILVARMGGTGYRDLFFEAQPDDAFTAGMTNALADFRKLVSYSNVDGPSLPWSATLDMVLNGEAAMTIMGDWGKGYANAAGKYDDTFGVMPTPGTAGTFVFTTDTFGLPIGARHPEETRALLEVFGSREGQDVFNPTKGSISARKDSDITNPKYMYDAVAKQTFDDFIHADLRVPATSILAPQLYVDAISAALAELAAMRAGGNPSTVQHALDNYLDVLLASCWPKPALNCPR